MRELTIIGGGLAGCEAAWQAAERGIKVRLYEMRPSIPTGAHVTAFLAELVCSNSLGSNQPDRAAGLLKAELRRMGSLLLKLADECALPAGSALAVDREQFAQRVTAAIYSHPHIEVVRQEARTIPSGPAVIASGPLTSPALVAAMQALTGEQNLAFFDAIAPIVSAASINMQVAFRASRFEGDSPGEYINCPLTRSQYETFVEELRSAERIRPHDFEQEIETGVRGGLHRYFEGCLPVEVIAQRGPLSLAFGPMRPVGLFDPHTNSHPAAVVQLRQDNLAGSLFNMVGFQTNLTYPEQRRVFRLIPGLEQAEFLRYGQMHRNTFLAAPLLLDATLQYRGRENLFFAGQITGVEGYVGNIATGLLAGWNAANLLNDLPLVELPLETMTGALLHYISHADLADFQPMKANFGLFPAGDFDAKGKRGRAALRARSALDRLEEYLRSIDFAQETRN
jgi:methylenetetrahydrofolate--tRNA-(uracil-5-)-methyltransferase